MPRALSGDLRRRVIETIEGGASCGAAAERFGVGWSTAIAWRERYRRTGEVEAVKVGGDKRSEHIEAHADFLLGLVEAEPDVTLAEMRERLIAERDERFGIGTLWRFFDRRGVRFRKKTAHAAEQDRPNVLRRRRAWFAGQLDLDPARLVFVDEPKVRRARLA